MTDVFEQELWDAWGESRLPGLLGVWLFAVRELFTVAMPHRLLDPRTVVSALSLFITTTVFATLIRLLQDPELAMWVNHTFLGGACH